MAVPEWIMTGLFAVVAVVFTLLALGLLVGMVKALRANDFPHRRRFCKSRTKLNGKTVIITGGNSGIGYETAKDLERRGARVILGCRSMERGNKAKQQITDDTGNSNVIVIHLDLSDLDSVRKFAEEVTNKETKLHLLINNAGIGFDATNPTTKQGFDAVFGTNYLGHFLLTYLLMDLLEAAAPSRIVNVSSILYVNVRSMDFTKEEAGGNHYPKLEGYEISKLANILNTKELAKRLKGSGVTSYSLHPGFIDTNILSTLEGAASKPLIYIIDLYRRIISLDSWTGAQCTLYCALEESLETVSGHYYENCKQVVLRNKLARDDKLATLLWDESLKMVGISQLKQGLIFQSWLIL